MDETEEVQAEEDEQEGEDEEEEEALTPEAKWEKSKAKRLLREDIIRGDVHKNMGPLLTYSTRPEYAAFRYENFRTNLNNLHKAIEKDIQRMQKDVEFYGHDRARLLELRDKPVKSWHTSQARVLLKQDMEAGLHNTKNKKEFWMSRPEYHLEWPLPVFRDAISSAIDKADKKRFRFEKKKYRDQPPAMPETPLTNIPLAFGASKSRKKKGKKKDTTTASTVAAHPPPKEDEGDDDDDI